MNKEYLVRTRKPLVIVKLITGRGRHSRRLPVIQHTMIDYLNSNNYQFEICKDNDGCINVSIHNPEIDEFTVKNAEAYLAVNGKEINKKWRALNKKPVIISSDVDTATRDLYKLNIEEALAGL